MSLRPIIVLCLVGASLIVGVVLGTAGGSGHDKLPEAGSSFGAAPRKAGDPVHLLDALAPLLTPARPASLHSPDTEPQPARARRARRRPLHAGEAAAQLFLVGFQGTAPRAGFFDRLRVRAWGGVVLERANYVDPVQVTALAGEVGVVARNAGRPSPIVAAVQDGGPRSAFPDLPPASQPPAAAPTGARSQARAAGEQLRALGVRMTLAPVADLGPAGGPHENDAFSDLPGAAARSVRAAVGGYRASRVVAVPGHFPGEGAASQDPSLGAATVGLSLGQLRGRDMLPFATVAKHAAAIQLSDSLYASFDGVTPATLLPRAVAELRRLGFTGVVVSGDLAAATLATGGTAGDAAIAALQAGCDLLWLPGSARDQEDAWRAVVRAIRSGKIRASRVTSALRRVAAMKKAYGIG